MVMVEIRISGRVVVRTGLTFLIENRIRTESG